MSRLTKTQGIPLWTGAGFLLAIAGTIHADNASIPTETFPLANDRILAVIKGGQQTTDHLMGISTIGMPAKTSPNLLQGVRVRLRVDGKVAECYDHDDRTTITHRGYVPETMAVQIDWEAEGLAVTDLYFIPPDLDVVVQRTTVRNPGAHDRQVGFFGILYPQLGSEAGHRKGICQEAFYDPGSGAILVQDHAGNVLFYGWDKMPEQFQVGEVCAPSDVYFVLERGQLQNHPRVSGVVPNAALGDSFVLRPGQSRTVEMCLGRADSRAAALQSFQQYHTQRQDLLAQHQRHWKRVLERREKVSVLPGLPPRLAELERRGLLLLNACLLPEGAPLGGFGAYRDTGQTRNACYILTALDEAGYHHDVKAGLEYYAGFRLGDDRFFSADENDQFGTILHVFKRHHDLTRDVSLLASNRTRLFGLADRLVELTGRSENGLIWSERAIHEYAAVERGYETYVNTMAWRGLQDAAEIAGLLNDPERSSRYAEAAARVRQAIVTQLVDPEKGIFVKRVYQGQRIALPAVSMLAPAVFGVLDPKDPIVDRTLAYVLDHLWETRHELGGIYRYPLACQPWDEHPYGGPWVLYTSWLGRLYLLRGENEKARELIEWVVRNTPADSNLIPEHFSAAHAGRRGFCRVYVNPSTPELLATAEFLRFVRLYRQSQ